MSAVQRVFSSAETDTIKVVKRADIDASGHINGTELCAMLQRMLKRSPTCQYRGLDWQHIVDLLNQRCHRQPVLLAP